MEPVNKGQGSGGVGATFDSFLEEEGLKDGVLERYTEKYGIALDELVHQVGLAADKIWEVGKSWEHFSSGSFGRDMKNLSSDLHEVRRQLERHLSIRRVVEVEHRKLRRIEEAVMTARRQTGGPDGELLQEAHEIISKLLGELKNE